MIPEIKKKLSNERLGGIKLIVLIGLGLFIIPLSLNASTWTDDFDDYDLGDFKNNGVWEVFATDSIYVINNFWKSYPQSLDFHLGNINRSFYKDLDSSVYSGDFKFYFKVESATTSGTVWVTPLNILNNEIVNISIQQTSYYGGDRVEIFIRDSFGAISFATPTIPTNWISFETEWKCVSGTTTDSNIRYKYNDGYWTDWRPMGNCWEYGVKRLRVQDYPSVPESGDNMLIYFDSFSQLTGYGICGTDLDCVFCTSQSVCENNGCFWIIGDWADYGFGSQCVPTQPYIEEIASSTFNATSFYASNSQYSTPTGLYTSLTNVSGGILGYLSSWLEHFQNLFDLTQAREKGIEAGEAIPRARGYLDLFNDLFSNFPVSEIIILYLILMVAIIIFRIVRHIKGLLPFQ
jgi:hypothetical protein